MKKKQKKSKVSTHAKVLGFYVALGFGVLIYTLLPVKPHYKVGQCYAHFYKATESWEKDQYSIYRILAIGKTNYQTQLCLFKGECAKPFDSSKISFTEGFGEFERYNNKSVSCPTN